jgi:hypothetical protein
MDLGHLEGTRSQQCEAKQRELAAEEGDNVNLVLQLPDGTQHTHAFKMGATVAYVKLQVEQNYSIPMVSWQQQPCAMMQPVFQVESMRHISFLNSCIAGRPLLQ